MRYFHFFLKHSFSLFHTFHPILRPASDRGRDKNGKLRPKSEGFELYNSSVQNGSPESPQAGWDSYPEPKKMSGEDRLLKNRADHRSSPNVASKPSYLPRFYFIMHLNYVNWSSLLLCACVTEHQHEVALNLFFFTR